MGGDGWGLHFIMFNCVIVLWHSWVYLFHTLSAKEKIFLSFFCFHKYGYWELTTLIIS